MTPLNFVEIFGVRKLVSGLLYGVVCMILCINLHTFLIWYLYFKTGHVTLTTSIRGQSVIARLRLDIACLSSSSLARSRRRRGPLRRSTMTASDSVSSHIGWGSLAVVTDLVQPSFRGTTGTTFPRTIRGSTKRQVDLATYGLMQWDIARHPSDVTENGIVAFDDVIDHWGETGLDCDFSVTDIWSCHLMPSIWRWHFIWKLSKILTSSARTVHVSAAYRRVERISALYVGILILSDRRLSRQILDKDAITDEARAIRLLMSGRH